MWLLWLASAFGADWLTLQNTEEGRDDEPVHVFGFIQPQFDAIVGGEQVQDQTVLFNTVNGQGPSAFQIRRARLAVRGSVPKTNQRVSYYLMTESGEVSLTRGAPVVFTDMYVTLSAPGVRMRVGQGKLPVMEEIVQGVASSLEFIHFSNTLTGLMLENNVVAGEYSGPAYGFRDVGVQLFEGFQKGHVAGSYALMVSNGSGIHAVDTDAEKDVTARGELGWVTDGEKTDGRRKEIKAGAWWLEGSRRFDDGDRYRRMRRGAFLHVEQGVAWSLVEWAQGDGMLEAGRAPPFAGGLVTIAPEGTAWGVVGSGGVRVDVQKTTLGAKLRYDEFHRRTEVPEAERVFRTVTGGLEVNPHPLVRLQGNYELRRLAAPAGDEAAQTIADAMGDRVTFQITARMK